MNATPPIPFAEALWAQIGGEVRHKTVLNVFHCADDAFVRDTIERRTKAGALTGDLDYELAQAAIEIFIMHESCLPPIARSFLWQMLAAPPVSASGSSAENEFGPLYDVLVRAINAVRMPEKPRAILLHLLCRHFASRRDYQLPPLAAA